ncbi:hypothetical protein GB937_010807 [Aspergillus fischeri]|nr:hypothetical protein GB937_010807 [Aspergillus fischeri]
MVAGLDTRAASTVPGVPTMLAMAEFSLEAGDEASSSTPHFESKLSKVIEDAPTSPSLDSKSVPAGFAMPIYMSSPAVPNAYVAEAPYLFDKGLRNPSNEIDCVHFCQG